MRVQATVGLFRQGVVPAAKGPPRGLDRGAGLRGDGAVRYAERNSSSLRAPRIRARARGRGLRGRKRVPEGGRGTRRVRPFFPVGAAYGERGGVCRYGAPSREDYPSLGRIRKRIADDRRESPRRRRGELRGAARV